MNQIPQSIHAECPECRDETLHRTIKGRMKGKKRLEMVLKCTVCGKVHEEALEAVGQIPVRMIISRGEKSEKVQAEFPEDWELAVGDEFMHEDERLLIKGIEVDGRHVENAVIKDVQTLWTINYDTARVRVSVNRGGRTKSLELEVEPGEEFEVGAEIEIDGMPVMIHSIKLENRTIRRGTATAGNIVRVYCTDKRPPRPGRRRYR